MPDPVEIEATSTGTEELLERLAASDNPYREALLIAEEFFTFVRDKNGARGDEDREGAFDIGLKTVTGLLAAADETFDSAEGPETTPNG